MSLKSRTGRSTTGSRQGSRAQVSLPPTALAALRQHPLFVAAVLLSSEAVESTYYDTPDFALRACGIALRLRRAGDIWRQTVKCAATSTGGLAARPEWEQPWGGHFDFCGVTDARVRTFLVGNAARLTPVFNPLSPRDPLPSVATARASASCSTPARFWPASAANS
ncbi:MAG: CYTH domain-containing protein [Gammaproteobacteria bacterium]|nr:CYTH domain-containing protein [Gammaproteobacteria bacterium]